MARRVTIDDIRTINETYYQCKNYTETARITGWSVATVRNYVDKNYNPVIKSNIHRFDLKTEMPEFSTERFVNIENLGDLCVLSEEELVEIARMWEEIEL